MPRAAHWNKKLVNIAEAKAQLSRLIERGEVILIRRYGRVVARLVPPEQPAKPKRVPGVWKGKVWMAPDFGPRPPIWQATVLGRTAAQYL